MEVHGHAVTTYLFTDIEGSTRLWDTEPERMRAALARHDALTRDVVATHKGKVVKTTGDGFHAVFEDPLDALSATVDLQLRLQADGGGELPVQVRTGLHTGVDEQRDNDFYGPVVNRAARIMSAAHGGQILVSQAVVNLVTERLPTGITLRPLGRVRLRDLAEPEPLFQVLHAGLRHEFPALRSLESTPNNLPQQTTSFVGRERELREISERLREVRLLTLVGTGGLGKTRLSLQVAADVLDAFPDGAWFIELAAISDESRVVQAVATALGVKEEPGLSLVDSLIRFLSSRHLLLILDNCEHLVRACAELCKRILQSTPDVRVLASSREALRVGGEVTYAVHPLSVPDPARQWTQASLAQFEAARLFVSRVTAAQPAFAFDDDNAPAIAEICHRLDGIPLALELAAARARSLPVKTIAGRLSDRFRLLSRGDQTALPRQQTLRALIDWSHDLLSEPERILFRRLGVFAGGWTLEAAEAVCGGAPLDAEQVIDLLTLLVEKSLVAIDPLSGHYRFLDTIAQYARERLQDGGDNDAVRSRHLDHYLALAEKARPEFSGPHQAEWLARFDLESDNVSQAHAWCAHADDGARKDLRLVYGARIYWFTRGMLGTGRGFTLEALARLPATDRSSERSRALFHAGQFGCFMGDYAVAQRHLEESLAIARELGDKGRIAAVLQPLGTAMLGQGDVAAAQHHLEEAVATARTLDSKDNLAAALNALAQLHRMRGDLETARTRYDDVVRLARESGDRSTEAIGMLNLAIVDIERRQEGDAHRLLLDTLAIAGAIGSKQLGQSAVEVCSGLAAMLNDWSTAATFFGAAEAQVQRTGLHRDPADEAFLAPRVERTRSMLGAEEFASAERAGRAMGYEQATHAAREWLERRR
jgi:predicted ATPase/class 3 adenylate cyclase